MLEHVLDHLTRALFPAEDKCSAGFDLMGQIVAALTAVAMVFDKEASKNLPH